MRFNFRSGDTPMRLFRDTIGLLLWAALAYEAWWWLGMP